MSIKHKESVQKYVVCQAELVAAIENLREFVEDLPAPDDDDTLPNLDYGHLGTLQEIRKIIAEAMRLADAFCK